MSVSAAVEQRGDGLVSEAEWVILLPASDPLFKQHPAGLDLVKRMQSPEPSLTWELTLTLRRTLTWPEAETRMCLDSLSPVFTSRNPKHRLQVDVKVLTASTSEGSEVPGKVLAKGRLEVKCVRSSPGSASGLTVPVRASPYSFTMPDGSMAMTPDFQYLGNGFSQVRTAAPIQQRHVIEISSKPADAVVEIPLAESNTFCGSTAVTANTVSYVVVRVSMTHYSAAGRPGVPGRLKALLDSGSLSDVTFLVSGEEIPAHRVVLGAASQVFCAMFTHDTEDKRTGRVQIKDTNPAAFKEMLRCVYSDAEPDWPTDDKLLLDLLLLAEKYELGELRMQCQRQLLSTLTTDNVCGRLKMVDVVCPALVPQIATTTLFKSNLREILSSVAWLQLQMDNAALAAVVMHTAFTSP